MYVTEIKEWITRIIFSLITYNPDKGEFSVRKGYSYKQSESLSWDGDEKNYAADEFIEQYPEYEYSFFYFIEM